MRRRFHPVRGCSPSPLTRYGKVAPARPGPAPSTSTHPGWPPSHLHRAFAGLGGWVGGISCGGGGGSCGWTFSRLPTSATTALSGHFNLILVAAASVRRVPARPRPAGDGRGNGRAGTLTSPFHSPLYHLKTLFYRRWVSRRSRVGELAWGCEDEGTDIVVGEGDMVGRGREGFVGGGHGGVKEPKCRRLGSDRFKPHGMQAAAESNMRPDYGTGSRSLSSSDCR